jgi:hypothetical protein
MIAASAPTTEQKNLNNPYAGETASSNIQVA